MLYSVTSAFKKNLHLLSRKRIFFTQIQAVDEIKNMIILR